MPGQNGDSLGTALSGGLTVNGAHGETDARDAR